MKEFKDNGVKVHIATDDGSVGAKGRVSVLFDKIDKNPGRTFIYTCGPNPMMKCMPFSEDPFDERGNESSFDHSLLSL